MPYLLTARVLNFYCDEQTLICLVSITVLRGSHFRSVNNFKIPTVQYGFLTPYIWKSNNKDSCYKQIIQVVFGRLLLRACSLNYPGIRVFPPSQSTQLSLYRFFWLDTNEKQAGWRLLTCIAISGNPICCRVFSKVVFLSGLLASFAKLLTLMVLASTA